MKQEINFSIKHIFFSQKLIAQNCFNHSTWIIYMAQVQALSEFGRHINQSIRYFSASTRNGIIGCCKNFKRKSVLSKVSDLGAYSFVTHTVLTLA